MIPSRRLRTRCCIAGGGPAGMMLGLLLARGGVDTVVLEKHADFLRDFRGDTVHPSTLEVLAQIGLGDAFDRLPQRRETTLHVRFAEGELPFGDFTGLEPFDYMALVPQWDFLDMLAGAGRALPCFGLRMATRATGLLFDADGCVRGVAAEHADGPLEIEADLVVGCDGRHSTLREAAALDVDAFGAPMDALWFRLPREPGDVDHTYGAPARGRMLVMLNRNDYWQCAYLIRKGSGDALRAQPLQAFRDLVAPLLPFDASRMQALQHWDEVKLLEVRVDRLRRWHRPGLLMIGDAAHAMSPVGGVGINLAIQDAVAAANLLGPALRDGVPVDDALLAQVQSRRAWPTRVIQGVQRFAHAAVVDRLLAQPPGGLLPAPSPMRFASRFRFARSIPARLFGYGIRRERVEFGPRASEPESVA